MAKRRKKEEIIMIDMSPRLDVKIVPATEEELLQANIELEELSMTIQNKMQAYNSNLFEYYKTIVDQNKIIEPEKDSSYFLKKYGYMIEKRNINNVQERIEELYLHLKDI